MVKPGETGGVRALNGVGQALMQAVGRLNGQVARPDDMGDKSASSVPGALGSSWGGLCGSPGDFPGATTL